MALCVWPSLKLPTENCPVFPSSLGETTPLPGRTDELRKMFFDLLERVAKAKDVAAGKRNLVLIIDAVNQVGLANCYSHNAAISNSETKETVSSCAQTLFFFFSNCR